MAADAIGALHADVALIGADGITLEGGVRAFSIDDAAVVRAMSTNASKTVALASPVKIGVDGRARMIDWPAVDELVTTALPAEFAVGLQKLGVHVTAAS